MDAIRLERSHLFTMCGICGFISVNESADAGNLLKMNNAIRHRGPDDEGYAIWDEGKWLLYAGEDSQPKIKQDFPFLHADKNVRLGLGFRRLSIIDVSHLGHQPMVDDTKQVALTFNGEIYNYKELREELKKEGYVFKSQTDTEVILAGYLHWGMDIVNLLNGMFAFALADHSRKKLWLVRDRMGIKPLFYHTENGKLSWASEIKAVLQLPWVKREVDFKGLTSNYLLQTTVPPFSCFKNIRSVRPAHFLEADLHTLQCEEKRYWQLPEAKESAAEESGEQLHYLLKKAVARQLIADVPAVSLMSGGIDSTTITALAKQFNPSIESYTMGFHAAGKNEDELPQAKAMAEKLGIRQNIHIIRPEDITQDLLATLQHYEEPYSSLETVVEAARFIHTRNYKVALNGNGADELLGGYGYVLQLKKWQQRKKAQALAPFIPPVHSLLVRIKNYLGLNSVFRFFVNSTQGMRLHQLQELHIPGYENHIRELLADLPVDEKHYSNDYEALFQYDMHYSVAAHHVYRDDMSAMRHSLEMRYPYLDHELIDYVARLPVSTRYKGNETKPLLRKLAHQYVLPDNLSMPKKGFSMPGDTWMKKNPAISSFAQQHIEALIKRGIFNNSTIKKWWQQREQPFTFHKIWQLVTTEVWLSTYVD